MGTSARDTNQQDVSSQKHPPPLLSPRRLLPRKQHQLKLKLPLPRLLPPKLPLPRLLPSKLPQQRLPPLRLLLLRLLKKPAAAPAAPAPVAKKAAVEKKAAPAAKAAPVAKKAAALKTAVKEKKEAVKAETLKGKGM